MRPAPAGKLPKACWTERARRNRVAGENKNGLRTKQLFTLNKRAIIKKITAKLVGELEIYFRAAQFSRAEATHESNKAENKYDTRGLEASYSPAASPSRRRNSKPPSPSMKSSPSENSRTAKPLPLARWWNWSTAAKNRFIFSARAPAAPKCYTTKKKSSSSPPNRRWANSSWAKNQPTSHNSIWRRKTNGENHPRRVKFKH